MDRIVLLLVSLQSVAAVRTACIEKLQLTAEQADLAIEHAKKAIIDAAEIDRDKARGEAVFRLNDLYERCLRVQDVKSALAAQKELNRLLALHTTKAPPEEPASGLQRHHCRSIERQARISPRTKWSAALVDRPTAQPTRAPGPRADPYTAGTPIGDRLQEPTAGTPRGTGTAKPPREYSTIGKTPRGPSRRHPRQNADSRGTRRERRCGTTPANSATPPMRRQPAALPPMVATMPANSAATPIRAAHPPALRAFLRTQKRQVQSIDPCPDRRSLAMPGPCFNCFAGRAPHYRPKAPIRAPPQLASKPNRPPGSQPVTARVKVRRQTRRARACATRLAPRLFFRDSPGRYRRRPAAQGRRGEIPARSPADDGRNADGGPPQAAQVCARKSAHDPAGTIDATGYTRKRLQARQFRRWSIEAKPPTKPMTYIRLRGRARDCAKNKPCVTHCYARLYKSGRQDLNLRPSEPHSDALARLRHAPYDRPASQTNDLSITRPNRFWNGGFFAFAFFPNRRLKNSAPAS